MSLKKILFANMNYDPLSIFFRSLLNQYAHFINQSIFTLFIALFRNFSIYSAESYILFIFVLSFPSSPSSSRVSIPFLIPTTRYFNYVKSSTVLFTIFPSSCLSFFAATAPWVLGNYPYLDYSSRIISLYNKGCQHFSWRIMQKLRWPSQMSNLEEDWSYPQY